MKIIYITFVDFGNLTSGSQIRPQKMYDAFIQNGYKVDLLSGSQKPESKKNRIKQINEIEKKLKSEKYDFCYIESPSDPILFYEDKRLIKKIHSLGIPIGYFYRDAYYKLGKEYFDFNGKSIKGRIREIVRYYYYKFLFYKDDLFLKKNIDIVYFPSMTMASYFNFKHMDSLPPAGENLNILKNNSRDHLIYVGAISKAYGIDLVLETLKKINTKYFIPLYLICRKGEGEDIIRIYQSEEWLKIIHASGSKLEDYYNNSKIALLPKINSAYSDMSISVKLFEYMSYQLPILASNVKEQALMITNNNIGWIYKNEINDMEKMIIKAYYSDTLNLMDNVKNTLINENLWIHRAEKVKNDLINTNIR